MPEEIFDVCVIGTGAGGGVMLKELTAAGMRVVALERSYDADCLRIVIKPAVGLHQG